MSMFVMGMTQRVKGSWRLPFRRVGDDVGWYICDVMRYWQIRPSNPLHFSAKTKLACENGQQSVPGGVSHSIAPKAIAPTIDIHGTKKK